MAAIESYIDVYTYPDGRVVDTFRVKEPLENLVIINSFSSLEDLDDFIDWVKNDLIAGNIPDFSEPGAIIDQGFLWGSIRSRLVDLDRNGPAIEREEFETAEFLKLCLEWRVFLMEKREGKRP